MASGYWMDSAEPSDVSQQAELKTSTDKGLWSQAVIRSVGKGPFHSASWYSSRSSGSWGSCELILPLSQSFKTRILTLWIFVLKILFLERGGERERNNVWLPPVRPLLGTWLATRARALTGNRTSNPVVPRPELHPPSHTSQDCSLLITPVLAQCHLQRGPWPPYLKSSLCPALSHCRLFHK